MASFFNWLFMQTQVWLSFGVWVAKLLCKSLVILFSTFCFTFVCSHEKLRGSLFKFAHRRHHAEADDPSRECHGFDRIVSWTIYKILLLKLIKKMIQTRFKSMNDACKCSLLPVVSTQRVLKLYIILNYSSLIFNDVS